MLLDKINKEIVPAIPIQTLTLVAACGCSLKCNYCQIAQNENGHSAEFQKNTRLAFEDGSYLRNSVTALRRLEQAPSMIDAFEIWGQEPTLILDAFTADLPNWLKAYPKLQRVFFSSNGMQYPERIVDFVKTLEENIDHPFLIGLQFSYDGEISTKYLRGADGDLIQHNILKIINELNSYSFRYVKLTIGLHGVTSLNLMRELDTVDKIYKYYEDATNWAQTIKAANLNKSIDVDDHVSFYFETPMDASTEDGLMISDFYRKSCSINPKLYTHPTATQSVGDMTATFKRAFEMVKKPGTEEQYTDEEIIDILYGSQKTKEWNGMVNCLSGGCFCCSFVSELKMMYDGTCLLCQNTLFNSHDDVAPKFEGNDIKTGAFENFLNHHFYLNPLTCEDKDLARMIRVHSDAKRTSFIMMYNSTVSLMLWLLKAHQIDQSYKDPNKLLLHALYMTVANTCSYNHYIMNGSFFCKDVGLIRAYCNGWLDSALRDDIWREGRYLNAK